MTIPALVAEIEARVAAEPVRSAPALRALRREYSKNLKESPPAEVVKIATLLVSRKRVPRFIGDELIATRPDALRMLRRTDVEKLGDGIASWGDVDCFACLLAGPAWREGRIGDDTIIKWARSEDRWWRRAALVSTVPLNVKARGGTGDRGRTLRICEVLIDDRDDMVVKALSWALRALLTQDAKAVQQFVAVNQSRLASRVLREVRQKLATGRKNPRPRLTASRD